MKKAFTMLELVFVIVVIGIISAVVIPSTKTNPLREAAIQVVSHIRYTQHLAIVDDKFNSNDADWYRSRWEILFGSSASTNGRIAYSIFSDRDNGSGHDTKPNKNELAVDPAAPNKYLSGGYSGIIDTDDSDANKKMNLGESYGVDDVKLKDGCLGVRISFDHLGRPMEGTFNTYAQAYKKGTNIGLIQSTCNIVLTSSEGNVTIAIEPETGYAHIKN